MMKDLKEVETDCKPSGRSSFGWEGVKSYKEPAVTERRGKGWRWWQTHQQALRH